MAFPSNFTWGASTASYQIEGGADQDGRGLSVWDVYSRTPGNTWQGHTGDVACDFYNRWRQDIPLMTQIGIKAFRMSIAWTRILPEGTGTINQKGLDFYDQLVDGLLASGIEPYVTLFHWDYPQELYLKGGWLNRDTVRWFEDYTKIVVDRLGDRVSRWMTLNEPQVFCKMGHSDGVHAPGRSLRFPDVLLCIHHALMSHGAATQVIRARAKKAPLVGWAPVCVTKVPASNAPADIEAARIATWDVLPGDPWNNAWYYDPVIFGKYPEQGLKAYGADVPKIHAGDMELMKQPLDWVGVNIYNAVPVQAKASPTRQRGIDFPKQRDTHYLEGDRWISADRAVGHPLTFYRWTIEADSLYWGPKFVAERYKLPVFITENGMSEHDWICMDGKVHDSYRIDFTRRYLLQVKRLVDEGVDLRGYFHWSLFDNYEWAEGYRERFGLIYVDYPTQRRVLKDSAHWYNKVIASNGQSLDDNPFA
jgi:beta-glucosidase